jgi:hypothetical protein
MTDFLRRHRIFRVARFSYIFSIPAQKARPLYNADGNATQEAADAGRELRR